MKSSSLVNALVSVSVMKIMSMSSFLIKFCSSISLVISPFFIFHVALFMALNLGFWGVCFVVLDCLLTFGMLLFNFLGLIVWHFFSGNPTFSAVLVWLVSLELNDASFDCLILLVLGIFLESLVEL